MREKARTIPELVVEPGAVRHVGSSQTAGIRLTRPEARDYAVRVRYTGGAQVSLRMNPAGFIYVLAQRHQTIFQRYDKGAADSVVLRPVVPHPAGFDASQPHELLVTMQGPVIRAWLDGRFVGEALDATFTAGTADLMFTKYSAVHQVEIAELSDGPEAWTDWLGPRLAAGNFQGNGLINEGYGISTAQDLKGVQVLPPGTRNGAIRVTFAMRDSEGVIIGIRETKEGAGRHLYNAQYTGKNLIIVHAPPSGQGHQRLVTQPIPDEVRALPEHTLEFRFVGDELTVILNDTHRATTRHSLLKEGLCDVVLTKGVLVKKVETQSLDGAPYSDFPGLPGKR